MGSVALVVLPVLIARGPNVGLGRGRELVGISHCVGICGQTSIRKVGFELRIEVRSVRGNKITSMPKGTLRLEGKQS
jgi:hypothetical protein